MEVKSRHHLRADAVDDLETALSAGLGVELNADSYELVELAGSEFDLVLVDGEPSVCYLDDDGERAPFLTVDGANEYPPTKHRVTVDSGAISFVSDGADVMRPGIVEADPDIEEGDLVVVDEENHGKVLAVGRALTDGSDMAGTEGRVVESIHHVGDDLYEFTV